jgi:hypothetical protein
MKNFPPLTPEQIKGLREYKALIDSPTWRQRLVVAWAQGHCNANGYTDTPYQKYLHPLRASHGEEWLTTFHETD